MTLTHQQKYGEVSWNDTSFTSSERGERAGRDLFLKLAPGSNVVRILTLPYQYYLHKYKFEGEKGFGHRIYCSAKHGSCAVCAKGDKPKRRWLIGVIDRKTNSYKILDIGWSILKGVKTYNSDEDWGDPTHYDIDIVVDPHGGATNYYSPVPKPKRPLSAQDLVLKEKVDLDDLERRVSPPLPERVEERFRSLMEEFLKTTGAVDMSSKSSIEEDEDFPDYDTRSKAGF